MKRFIICTLPKSVSKEKQEQGSLTYQKKQFNQVLNAPLYGVGAFLALFLLGLGFMVPSSAHAAESLGTTKKAIDNIGNVVPVVSNTENDQNSAMLSFAPDFVKKPLVIETKITPVDPPKPVYIPKKKVVKAQQIAPTVASAELDASARHIFPYGYCTYYVSTRRDIPFGGNAREWFRNAQAYGFETGHTPRKNAIIVTSEGGYTGHVAMVDAISEDGQFMTLTEMNYRGWGVVSSRTVSTSFNAIGYIY